MQFLARKYNNVRICQPQYLNNPYLVGVIDFGLFPTNNFGQCLKCKVEKKKIFGSTIPLPCLDKVERQDKIDEKW